MLNGAGVGRQFVQPAGTFFVLHAVFADFLTQTALLVYVAEVADNAVFVEEDNPYTKYQQSDDIFMPADE